MDFHGIISGWLLFLASTCWLCRSLLRRNCQVLEKKYYASFINLSFDGCNGFEDLDFSIAVGCDSVKDLHKALKEVPRDTDWLCFSNFRGVNIEAGAFSQFSNLKSLYISGDADLLPGAFSGLTQLTTLWIDFQTDNATIYEGTFHGLNSLQELKISRIPLTTFNLSILSDLHLLDHLILERNNIFYLSEVTTSLGIFRDLRKLSVINNQINELRYDDCITTQYGQSVRFVDFNISYLDLSGNDFDFIQNNSLCNFPHLNEFKAIAGNSQMDDILVSGIKTIKTILLSGNYYDGFQVCKYTSQFQAEEIHLSFGSILNFSTVNGSCKHLKKLKLSSNELRKVQVGDINKFSNLLELDLSDNHIEVLEMCANKCAPAMKLVYLNVSYNYLTRLQKGQFTCFKDLQILSLGNNKINHIEESAFHDLVQLQVLDLQHNNIFIIDQFTFANLFSLRLLNLYENMLLDFHPLAFQHLDMLQDISVTYGETLYFFPWISVPRTVRHISVKANILNWLNELAGDFPFLESWEIAAPNIIMSCTGFNQAKKMHLESLRIFKCESSEQSPLLNFTDLEKLYYTGNAKDLSDNTLSTLKHLPSLVFLYLQDTDIMVKYGQVNTREIFQGLSHLKVLHLKNSGIERWDSKEITRDLQELEFLFIENQRIEELQVTIFDSMPNLKHIYFLETAFTCSCKVSELLSWLESGTSVSIINFHQQKCQLNQNSTNLISFLQSNCHTQWDLIMFLVTFHFTLLFMCVSLFYESIWWYLLYLIYTLKCWLNHRQRDMGQYDYDVFVSYNSHNESWVLQKLLPNLELNGPPFFKVCIHNRDFEIGRDIVDNIMDSIYKSKWTVCIISRHYLQSNWCSLEMRMATYRLLAESKDSLVLIFIDKISREELQHYHRLTKLMDKKTYLDWPEDENGQQLFWARLRTVIAKSGRKLS